MPGFDFNSQNAHQRDEHLSFDSATHTYYCHGHELRSVTTVVEDYFPKFDADKWAPRIAARENVTPEEIKARWERCGRQARELGSEMHDKIERFYLGCDDGDNSDALRLFRLFAEEHHLHPYRTEWRIYDEDLGVAGTLDFLEYTPDGKFNLWDWKRSSKLVDCNGHPLSASPYGHTGFYPISSVHDCPYWHYALQLNIYAYLLEKNYDIRVSSMTLGVFHPDYSRPWVLPLPLMRDHVVSLLRHRLSKGRECQAQ